MRKDKKEVRKAMYKKPILTKHKKLKDLTAGVLGSQLLGCTKNFGWFPVLSPTIPILTE